MSRSNLTKAHTFDDDLISVVFATRDRLPYLQNTMNSIRTELDGKWPYEVVVVDGQSRDGTVEYLKTLPHVRVIVEEKLRGCCFAYDTAMRAARGTWVCWLNDDIEIVPGAFNKMMAFMNAPENRRVGMGVFTASASAADPCHFVLETCMALPIPYACFGFLRRDLLARVGYLDLTYRKYGWDPDLSMKIWDAGYTVEPCPGAHIIHYFAEDELRHTDELSRVPDAQFLVEKWRAKAEEIALSIDLTNPIYEMIWDELDPRFQMQILVEQGRLEEAEKVMRDRLATAPKILTEFYLLGVVMEKRGRVEEASPIYQRVMAYEAHNQKIAAWAHFKYGELLFGQGQTEEAADHWRHALRLNPDHAKANICLTPVGQPLRIICASKPHRRHGHIWVNMPPCDPDIWGYHFGQRKLDLFELHGSVLEEELEQFSSLLLRYLEEDGKFVMVENGKADTNRVSLSRLRNHLAKHGFTTHENATTPDRMTGKPLLATWIKGDYP